MRILGLIAAWLASLFFLLLSGLAGLSAMFVGWFGAAAAGLLLIALILNPLARLKIPITNTPSKRRFSAVIAVFLGVISVAGAVFHPERAAIYAIKDFGLDAEGLYKAGQKDLAETKDHPADYPEALRHFEAAAKKGHMGAEYELALMTENGNGVATDQVAAVAKLKSLADRHYADATATLGEWTMEGSHGITKDEQAGYALLKSAGKAGSDRASIMLIVRDMSNDLKTASGGELSSEDTDVPLLLYKLAADGGDTKAAETYGIILTNMSYYIDHEKHMSKEVRDIVVKEEEERVGGSLHDYMRYLIIAADSGRTQAQLYLGEEYRDGSSMTPKDPNKAFHYLSEAAKGGSSHAQLDLALLYHFGYTGVPVDKVKAVEFYKASADQGYPQAQLNLGAMYSKGEGGLKKNVAEARRLYELASKGDDLPTKAIAKKNLAALDWNEAHGFKN